MNNLYFGLDLSLSCPAFAVVAVEGGKPKLIEKSHVKTNAKLWHGRRLVQIEQELQRYLEKYDFTAIAREKGFSRHAQTTQALFKVVGVSDLTVAKNGGKSITDIAPTTVKLQVAGSGKASKDEVAKAVIEILGLQNEARPFVTDDESDACAVVLTYLKQNKLIGGF